MWQGVGKVISDGWQARSPPWLPACCSPTRPRPSRSGAAGGQPGRRSGPPRPATRLPRWCWRHVYLDTSSWSTAMLFLHCFPGGRDVGRRETAAYAEGPRWASTNDRWPSQGVTGPLGLLRNRPLPSMRRSWGCFITAEPLRTDRSGGNPALCPYLVCAPVPGGPARCGGNRRPRHVRL